jgi:solute carrier family 25 protein 39/40
MSNDVCPFCDSSYALLYESAASIYDKGKALFLPKENQLVRHATASLVGSVATILTLNPMFVLKVRVQNADRPIISWMTVLEEANEIKKSRGIRGFWSGTSTALMMSIPNTVVYMTAYEKCKSSLSQRVFNDHPPTYVAGISGAIARMISVSVVAPFELVRTMQSSGNSGGFLSIAKAIVQQNGARGLYKGWSSTIMRDCPFSALYWFSFEAIKPIATKSLRTIAHSEDSFSPMATFISGSTAGTIAAVITHPFDVLKTKQQLSASTTGTLSFLRNSSFQILTRGLGLRLLTVIPACGIIITVYEGLKSLN